MGYLLGFNWFAGGFGVVLAFTYSFAIVFIGLFRRGFSLVQGQI
jgi:hypothetical protein